MIGVLYTMKLRILESYSDSLYCVVMFDYTNWDGYNSGCTLVAFDNLGNAEIFEESLYQHVRNAEYDDEIDPEFYGDSEEDMDYELRNLHCVGCYRVSSRDAINAKNNDTNIIPGYSVTILNQKDFYDHDILYCEYIPDKYFR